MFPVNPYPIAMSPVPEGLEPEVENHENFEIFKDVNLRGAHILIVHAHSFSWDKLKETLNLYLEKLETMQQVPVFRTRLRTFIKLPNSNRSPIDELKAWQQKVINLKKQNVPIPYIFVIEAPSKG